MALQLSERQEVVLGVINIDELFTDWKLFEEGKFSYEISCALTIAKKFLAVEEFEKLVSSIDVKTSLHELLEKIEDGEIRDQVQIQWEFSTSNINNSLTWRNKNKGSKYFQLNH